jgi:hypothetical protein
MILHLFSSPKMTGELIDTSGNKEGGESSGRIVHVQYDGRCKIEQTEIFFMAAMRQENRALPLPLPTPSTAGRNGNWEAPCRWPSAGSPSRSSPGFPFFGSAPAEHSSVPAA